MIAAITPIVMPAPRADQLNGTAYPGNSGSPVYHPETGAVLGVVNSLFVKGTSKG